MTRAFRHLVAGLALVSLLVSAANAAELTIGYLQLKSDKRYARSHTYARFLLEPLGRPYAGAKVAMDEIQFHGAAAGVSFALKRKKGRDAAALAESVRKMHEAGTRFFVTDLPEPVLSELASSTAELDLMLLNISAREDRLRGEGCQPHLMHIIPSRSMLTDALAQYLAFKKWREILVLQGPSEADARIGTAFAGSAAKFGLEITDTRAFVLSNDPRERSRNNISLLTGRGSYDAVFVADADGEFARSVPYQIVSPRPVVGAAGLGPMAWHWAWERHGAPQLVGRFEDKADRHMGSVDWAAWMAVKAIATAVQRTESGDFAVLRDYLHGPDLALDAFKGYPASFRPWNNQLRQPVLLATQNWIVARAPIEGFEHRITDLDTLGIDRRNSGCDQAR